MPDFKGHVTSLEKFMIMDAVKAWDGWAKWNFENRVAECEKMTKGVYPQNVIEKILNYQEYESIRDMLLNHLHERRYNKQLTYSNYYVMNKLRVMFARISVSMLEPDLVIMDEFQRFKFLLSSDDSELGILAHSFLSGHDTRVLLLSATPYKLYSTLEEIDENQLDEHYAEFFQVMNFLFDDEVKDIANSSDCVLLPAGIRSRKVQWEVPRKSNGWAYGFGRANVWYASEEDSRLQDYLTRLVKQIDEYDGENWIDKYAE